MARRAIGTYDEMTVGGERVAAFVPSPLPPDSPPFELEATRRSLLQRAEHALARLDLAGDMVPALDWFLYAFVRKEAVVSSQIEGTQASLIDLLASEAGQVTADPADIEEISNYVAALTFARAEITKADGLPLSMRLLNETHRRLMQGARGASKQPGEVRRSQNWIGGRRPGNAAYVPPPAHLLAGALSDLEKYIHSRDELPVLIRVGLLHVQFEMIHPYLDGNGRIGRLLIALLLEHWNLLQRPLLYLSLYFKRHRPEYYRRLNAVHADGDWEGWIDFFLDGVCTIADEGVASARELFGIVTNDRRRVLADRTVPAPALRLLELLPSHPIVTMSSVEQILETSKPTAIRAVAALQRLGVLNERTGRRRARAFGYTAYLEALRAGTELDEPSPLG